ncbi:WD repeat-containing protein 89-like protein [Morus notabilis]|uniref:WD repeat-containing protein 89-like protein n=1 Tax=Morus notabilis TaxID=981085 RepID=W9QN30_9ROSA|nr:WD repeat-containing protein 89 homolog [Morus notabilis]EXB36417.1 WD repeat-containing protein 89-like protein [Morus notabilis]
MEEATAMEVEEHPHSNPSSSNRVGLKNSIQTSFGEDYVFQIVPKNDWSSMAVSLSTNVVKLYSPVTGQFYGECKGHSDTINHIYFSGPSTPHVLHSCSSDGTIRAWDTRTFQQVSSVSAGSSQEIFSFSFGGSTDNLLAAGCKAQILFWDWRNKKQVACLEESHVEDVTQVHFIPNHVNKLASASVDGLICIFDTDGDINDDDNLESVINVETSIGKVGFFGETFQKLWCLTHIETLSIWDWKEARSEVNFPDARLIASNAWNQDQVDYFVDCHYSQDGERLWVVGGTNAGTLGFFPVSYNEAASIGSPEAVLAGGHTDIVRSVLPMSSIPGSATQSQGKFGWTGGEDGRLCCWLSDDSSEIDRSWISSTLVMKSPKNRKKIRHQPY